MEIGLHLIGDLELIAGQYKEVHPSFKRIDDSVFAMISRMLHDTYRRGADTDHFSAGLFGCRDLICHFRRDDAVFTVDMMLGRIFDSHRPESVEPDMQCGKDRLDSLVANLLQQFRCVMQPGGRCRDTAVIM